MGILLACQRLLRTEWILQDGIDTMESAEAKAHALKILTFRLPDLH